MPSKQEIEVAEIFRREIDEYAEEILLRCGVDVREKPLPDYYSTPVEDGDHPLAKLIAMQGVYETSTEGGDSGGTW